MSLATKALSLLLGALMLLSLFSLVATVHVAAQPGAGTWDIRTVDPTTGYNNYLDPTSIASSIAVDSYGYPHIAYINGAAKKIDSGTETLNYTFQDAAGWHNTIVVENAVLASCSLKLDANGYAHISYWTSSWGSPLMLEYAYQDAAGWHFSDVIYSTYGDGSETSLALDSHGYPHISFVDDDTGTQNIPGRVMYASADASGRWNNTTVDTCGAWKYNSLALDSNDYAHITYTGGGPLFKYAYQDAAGWYNTTLDSGPVVYAPSIAIDSHNYPHIIYRYNRGGSYGLEYAYQDAASWHKTEIKTGSGNTMWIADSLVLDSHDYPHVAYNQPGFPYQALSYAYQDAAGWHFTTNFAMPAYTGVSLALDSHVNPHISYYSYDYSDTVGVTNTSLMYAHWVPMPPTTLTATASPTSVAVNKPFWVNGALNTPDGTLKTKDGAPIAGAIVQLQKNVSGTWQNVAGKTTTTGATGAYRISTSEPATGTYQYRTTYAGNATYANATSDLFTVTITASPPGPSLTPKGR